MIGVNTVEMVGVSRSFCPKRSLGRNPRPIYPDAKGFYFKDNQERMWASMDEDKNLVYLFRFLSLKIRKLLRVSTE